MTVAGASKVLIFLLSITIFSSCSRDAFESQGGFNIYLKEEAPDLYSSLAFLQSGIDNVPSTITDFSCFTVNVTGDGIQPFWDRSDNNTTSDCTDTDNFNGRGQGIIARPVARGSTISLDVQSGSSRIVDVYGIYPAPIECGGSLANGSTAYAYLVGSQTTDILDRTSVTIPISYAGGASKFSCIERNGPAGVAPSACSYSSTNPTYTVGTAITNNTITCSGGAPTSYSISPSINTATGLTFSTTTGTISGTPTIAAASTAYTITATNLYGSTTAVINAAALMNCTRNVATTFNAAANTLPATVTVSYSMVGGGGGGANGAAGTNGTTQSGTFTIPAGQTLDVQVGGGGGGGGTGEGGGGGGGSSAIIVNGAAVAVANGGAGANLGLGGGSGGGGTNAGGSGGTAGNNLGPGGAGNGGATGAGGDCGAGGATYSGGGGGAGYFGGGGGGGDQNVANTGGVGGNGVNGGAAGGGGGGGGGGYGSGGGSATNAGGSNGAAGGGGATGANSWAADVTLPAAAGQGGGGPSLGGNAGLVIMTYSHTSCPL
ncbi:MAG TPA: hypothetical protein PLH57_02725 [Oligoflexia bacterium]|nr:hypothetical protein [Oligoflexia bacterium]